MGLAGCLQSREEPKANDGQAEQDVSSLVSKSATTLPPASPPIRNNHDTDFQFSRMLTVLNIVCVSLRQLAGLGSVSIGFYT